ncbi:uncharacterized protein LOC108864135 [Galendromus occidentalis]|uniref:Uncharacterized protein LOC108864135 n=1 Tax=Galendromus occidentalis TaxID=34638 RepID=A0AAJ7L3N6_9ACAR|nr:uncharacterized protein LOC108864135 [Galendromus occidentalis]
MIVRLRLCVESNKSASNSTIVVSLGNLIDSDTGSPVAAMTRATSNPSRKEQPGNNDDEHVVFAVTTLKRENTVMTECDSRPVYMNLAASVPFLAPQIRNFRPFGFCCTIM